MKMQMQHEQEPTNTARLPVTRMQQPEQAAGHERTTGRNKTGKRIVSKREYAAQLGRKAGASAFGLLLLGFCMIGALMAVMALCFGFHTRGVDIFGVLEFVGIAGAGAMYLGYLGRRTLKEAGQIEAGVPLTRANSADLPAPESLVRASSEPVQAQQAVLLRAAAEGQEKHQEQLLRAVQDQE